MSYQEKLDSARKLVEEHNSVLGGSETSHLDPDKFIECLKTVGGTTEERLKNFSYEDILSCMPSIQVGTGLVTTTVKPVALAKDIAKIFRGKEDVKSEVRVVSAKKADKMTLRELIETYDPENSDNAVAKRLKEISKGQKFIVYLSGHTVDVTTTLKLLEELKLGFDGRNDIEVDGEIKEVHHIGSVPDNFVEENPLYKGRPLRPDGTCDQTGRSWNGVCMKTRQLIRIAMEISELTDISIEKAHSILDIVMDDKAWDKLSQKYRKSVLEYKKRESLGNLPKLKLVLKKGGSESKNPFQQAKKVSFQKPQAVVLTPELEKFMTDKGWYCSRTGIIDATKLSAYAQYYEKWRQDNE